MAQLQIRFPDQLMERVNRASEASGLSKNDIIKLALQSGLTWMERNNYDLTQPLTDESRSALLAEIISQLQSLLQTAEHRIIRMEDQSPGLPLAAESAEPSGYQPRPKRPQS